MKSESVEITIQTSVVAVSKLVSVSALADEKVTITFGLSPKKAICNFWPVAEDANERLFSALQVAFGTSTVNDASWELFQAGLILMVQKFREEQDRED